MKASIGRNDDTNLNNEVTLPSNHLFQLSINQILGRNIVILPSQVQISLYDILSNQYVTKNSLNI